MNLHLGRSLFPNADPWERKRKMTALVFALAGSIVLIAGVAFLMVEMSNRAGLKSPDSNPRAPLNLRQGSK